MKKKNKRLIDLAFNQFKLQCPKEPEEIEGKKGNKNGNEFWGFREKVVEYSKKFD